MLFRLAQFEMNFVWFFSPICAYSHRKMHIVLKRKHIYCIHCYIYNWHIVSKTLLMIQFGSEIQNKNKRIPLICHKCVFLSLACPLASPLGLCPPPIINLKQDVSRQLSSQSLLSLLRYRSVLCYRLSWLLSPLLMFFCLGERKKLPQPEFTRGQFSNDLQSPHNENRNCQAVPFIH